MQSYNFFKALQRDPLLQVNMWNEIELLANDDTGTVQLPVGLGRECGTALYQVDTLLQITSSEKVVLIGAVVFFLLIITRALSHYIQAPFSS